MIATLARACDWLTEDNLTVAALRAKLLHDSAPELRTAEVAALPDSEEPSHVQWSAPAGSSFLELQKALGNGHQVPRLHGEGPDQYIFYPPGMAGRAFVCAVIAAVAGDTVTAITLRRDPRLD